MMRALLAAIIILLTALPVSAQQVVDSTIVDRTHLTIYPEDLSMITEVRRVNVPAGLSTIRFMGVSDQIIAQTAILQSFEGISLESNFDSDLITKGALLNKAVGKTLTIRRFNAGTGEVTNIDARLVSASRLNNHVQGAIFETEDGVEALECSGLFESILFNAMPEDLYPMPVLSVDVQADFAGEKEISLSYLSRGIEWKADYRLDVGKTEKGEGGLLGWLTLTNSTSKSFKDTGLAVVAGQLNRPNHNNLTPRNNNVWFSSTCWPIGADYALQANAQDEIIVTGWDGRVGGLQDMAAAPHMMMESEMAAAPTMARKESRQAKQEDLGDYKLYRVPQDVTVAAHQTKQIAFLTAPDVEFEKIYKYEFPQHIAHKGLIHEQPLTMRVEYELDNSKDGNLGKPLPKGTMRVMTDGPSGRPAFLGEDELRDLAIDLPVEVKISQSAAVMILPKIEKLSDPVALKYSAEIFNATEDEVTVEITIQSDKVRYDDISEESHSRKDSEIIPTYKFKVPPESRESFSLNVGK